MRHLLPHRAVCEQAGGTCWSPAQPNHPASRFSTEIELGVEHYADLGRIEQPNAPTRQAHQSFLTISMPVGRVEVSVGLGHGWTRASESWVSRLRLGSEF